MKGLYLKLSLIILLVGILACSSDDSSNEPGLSVNFKTVTSSFSTNSQSALFNRQATGGSFIFNEGFITLTAMEFEAESENDIESVEFELEGTIVIDFATGIPSPDIRNITIPAGTYEEVSVELEILDENDEPSVVLIGTYSSPEGNVLPVRFEFNSGETFEVEREGTIVFTENQSAIAQITFDPSIWFAEVTDDMMADANLFDGVVVISENQNSEIFDIVADGLDLATELEIEN